MMTSGSTSTFALRPMTAADLNRAVELSREFGWPHREEDWAFSLDLGEGIVAEVDGGHDHGSSPWFGHGDIGHGDCR